jgi:hypothetical protein
MEDQDFEHIEYLALNFSYSDLSDADKQLVDTVLGGGEEFELLKRTLSESKMYFTSDELVPDATLKASILNRFDEIHPQTANPTEQNSFPWLKIAAVALVLIISGIGLYVLFPGYDKEVVKLENKMKDTSDFKALNNNSPTNTGDTDKSVSLPVAALSVENGKTVPVKSDVTPVASSLADEINPTNDMLVSEPTMDESDAPVSAGKSSTVTSSNVAIYPKVTENNQMVSNAYTDYRTPSRKDAAPTVSGNNDSRANEGDSKRFKGTSEEKNVTLLKVKEDKNFKASYPLWPGCPQNKNASQSKNCLTEKIAEFLNDTQTSDSLQMSKNLKKRLSGLTLSFSVLEDGRAENFVLTNYASLSEKNILLDRLRRLPLLTPAYTNGKPVKSDVKITLP